MGKIWDNRDSKFIIRKKVIEMAVMHITKEDFKLETTVGVVLVDFYADWCGPCKMLAPVLEEVAAEVDIKIIKVNVDEARAIAAEFNVSSIPNLTLLKNGEMVHQEVGFKPKEVLIEMINAHK